MSPKSSWRTLAAVLLALALVAAACGDDDDDAPAAVEEPAAAAPAEEPAEEPMEESAEEPMEEPAEESAEEPMEEPAEEPMEETDSMMADESMDPIKIGLISQEEELFSFPEVRAVAEAYVAYFNAELGGIDGHPVELDACTVGDAVESHIACAQYFVNADDVHVVLNTAAGAGSVTTGAMLAEAGVANLGLGYDFPDYFVPNLYNFDPGLPGLAQVFFVFASGRRNVTTMTLYIADDPAFAPFVPALEAIAASNGITITEVIPLGFEPDLTGPVSAADTANEGWLFVLADGAQCTAAAAAVDTVGYGGHLFANDLCMSQDVVESGVLDGWSGPILSSAPTVDGGAEVDEIVRILDTYGGAGVQRAGLGGWGLANTVIARDILLAGGGAGATRESVLQALSTYSSSDLPGMPDVSCPGPDPWLGACNTSPLMATVADGQLTSPDGFVSLDFTELNFLLG
jgi:branched-chain amino acid transport system substrate-binding protein